MKKENKIIHISNTNINWDYRILRAIDASYLCFKSVQAIGINYDEGAIHTDYDKNIISLNLTSMNLKKISLFKYLRACLIYLEFLFKVVKMLVKIKPDVIHCHDTPALLPAALYNCIFKTKIIYDAHELMSNKGGSNIVISKIIYFIEKMCWYKVDHFVTVGELIKDWYINSFGEKENTIIYNTPFSSQNITYDYNEKYLEDKYKRKFNGLVKFVFVGQLINGRSIDIILDAFSKLNGKRFVVFFVGYGELSKVIKEYSRFNENILFHDAIPHDHLPNFLSMFDVGFSLIQPISLSDEYSLPNKLFEYLSANLLIIGSDLPEIKRLIDECNCGFVLSGDLFEFLQNDFDYSIKNSTNKNTLEKYLWPKQLNKLCNLYSRI